MRSKQVNEIKILNLNLEKLEKKTKKMKLAWF